MSGPGFGQGVQQIPAGVRPMQHQPGRSGPAMNVNNPALMIPELMESLKTEVELLLRENTTLKGEREEIDRKSSPLPPAPPDQNLPFRIFSVELAIFSFAFYLSSGRGGDVATSLDSLCLNFFFYSVALCDSSLQFRSDPLLSPTYSEIE